MDKLSDKCHIPLLKNVDHPALIKEWKLNHDAVAYEKNLYK